MNRILHSEVLSRAASVHDARVPGMAVHFRPAIPALVFTAAAMLPVATLWLARAEGRPVSLLTRDQVAIAELPPWTGLLSTLGLCVWAAAAAVALFAGACLRARDGAGLTPAGWLFGAGALSVVLLLDDAFLVHETLLPTYVGVPEKATYALYALFGAAWLASGRRFLLRTPWPLLMGAGVGFAASVGIDVLAGDRTDDLTILLEDGTKWLGITAWLAYIATTAAGSLREAGSPDPGQARARAV